MSDLRTLYPPIEPYESGTLDVGDGHSLFYERSVAGKTRWQFWQEPLA